MKRVGVWILSALMVLGTAVGLLFLTRLDKAYRAEKEHRIGKETEKAFIIIEMSFGAIASIFCMDKVVFYGKLCLNGGKLLCTVGLLGIFAGGLLAACIMDMRYCYVYNYVWWAGGAAGIGILVLSLWERLQHWATESVKSISSNDAVEVLGSLVIFVLLQELFFCRFYGRADCHAFVVCALAEGALGIPMKGYLIHMLLAFGILAIVQLIHGNVGADGNLKSPVPFLPYIAVSFWGILLFWS